MKTITLQEALRLVEEGETLSPMQRRQGQIERLQELVGYARQHSAHFKKLYAELGPAPCLEELPLTSKQELVANFDNWLTDPAITAAGVRAYLADPENSGRPFLDKYSALTTSGTTGDPMPLLRDAYHNTIHGALIQKRLLREVDAKIMSPAHSKIACVIATGSFVSSYSAFARIARQYPDHQHNLLAISAWEQTDVMVAQLNSYQPQVLTGYPSVLAVLALEQKQGRLDIAPQVIVCSAETLTPQNFSLLQSTFCCPVLNNYCSTEGGEAAMSCRHGRLHLNDDWVIVEPIDERGNPADAAVLSDAVLITDLTSFLQPIIRYRMDDRVRISAEPCSCGSSLPVMEISGRGGDQLQFGGRAIPAVRLLYIMEHLVQGALTYQIAQTAADRLELRVRLLDGIDAEQYFSDIRREIAKMLTDCACLNVQFAISDDPPKINERGGKLKNVMQEWKPAVVD